MDRLACTELVEPAGDDLDGGPGGGTRAQVTDHLTGCRARAPRLDELRKTIRPMSQPPSRPPRGDRERAARGAA